MERVRLSYKQIAGFLSIVAFPHYKVKAALPFDSVFYRCFCTGFYFFCWGVKHELAPSLADELLDLAVRVEALAQHPSEVVWGQNGDEAKRLLAKFFGDAEDCLT